MIFKSLTLNNIFSYYGSRTFELAPPAGTEGNIVVIMGRNGFGKTSLLNSVKLLFAGVTKELRQSVQHDRVPTEKCFVLGDNDWWGILNRKARNENIFNCSVSAVLLDENNREIQLERKWDLQNGIYQNHLTLKPPYNAPLFDDAAQLYLSGLYPLGFIPLFFFDGEEINYLAEANRVQFTEKFEQFLNIRPADNLKICLKELARKVESEYVAKDIKPRLREAESHQRALLIQRDELLEQKRTTLTHIETLDDDLRETRQKIRLLSGQSSIENNAKLEALKQAERQTLEQALTGLSEAFERDAFLRLNAALAEKAFPAVERCANEQSEEMSEMLLSLRESLKDVFTTPPYPEQRLTESQVLFYQKRVLGVLISRDVEEDGMKPFELAPLRAKKLLATLSAYMPRHSPDAGLRDALATALRADQQLTEIDKSLLEVRQLSDENKQQFQQLQAEEIRQKEALDKFRDEERDVSHKLAIIDRDIKPLDEKITELRQQARQSEQGRARIDLLERMQKLLDAYKQKLKEQQRGTLETYFNQHLANLLDSNQLIAETKIDDSFQLHYLDAAGAPVAMSSISAGMKQLAATALLWALKDACGRQLPVIIDTPLGRIDKQHQDNLLTRYYPKAATQVILLPTDSELDERKHRLLEPYIYREFHLRNPDGENTEIQDVTENKEVRYG
ncbi:DNA sulfur modification protein DndD [Methylomonas methanica]|uniref:DNA sulfur modification protein DndD n=1 Tax=Methylomonas methanica (strain DSM 25384 / MC09) TaxID=857087 RepID=F9ZZJ9_METMM|nr:DNA sulfur modification protein DndD [Methylomonas methanica]AEF98658.1 DNA sulfur modification protein DndD [Methylomonas methanica MC09]